MAPYEQSARREFYLGAWRHLRDGGWIYPCRVSRKDMQEAPRAPHENPGANRSDGEETPEAVFPKAWRPPPGTGQDLIEPAGWNWRFRVPDGETIVFTDAIQGAFAAVAGRDFGDFPIWRRDDLPAYELAVVVDDAAMEITEVVRGEDLLLSTCRQLLLYRALGCDAPGFAHTPLVRDAEGRRLAKRDAAMSLRHLRAQGLTPAEVRGRVDLRWNP
jgi:glutamyl-tRNA synthetase